MVGFCFRPLLLAEVVAVSAFTAIPVSVAFADDATTAPAAAAPTGVVPIPDYSGDLLNRAYLTGDWGGARTDLANKGFQLSVDYTQYLQSVTSGGLDRTTDYGGHLDYLMHFDLQSMGLVPMAFVTLRAESRYGTSTNAASGLILPVNTMADFPLTDELDDGLAIAVTDLNYTQLLAGGKLAVVVGKLDTLDADENEFASGRGKSQFMNANFIFNGSLALRLPYSTLGAAIEWMPTPDFSIKASIVNTVDSSTTTGFSDFGKGNTATLEADYQYRLGDLPGGMNLGGLYSFDQDFNEIGGKLIFTPGEGLDVSNKNSTWAVYWSAWQYLFIADPNDKPINTADGRPDHEGVGLFARFGFADQTTNPVEWSASAGLGGRGLIPTRQNDTYGVGYFYSKFQTGRLTGLLGIDDHSQGMEAYYNLAITPAAQFTFDLQVADSAIGEADTGVIVGGRLNLSF